MRTQKIELETSVVFDGKEWVANSLYSDHDPMVAHALIHAIERFLPAWQRNYIHEMAMNKLVKCGIYE